jgi:hypothetical protein
MSTPVAAQAGRTTDRVAVLSGILHAGVVAFGIFLADQSGSRNYLLLSAFAALGLVATLLARASVRTGSGAWSAGVVLVGLSVGVLACSVPGEGGLGILSIGILTLFLDWLLFTNARRAFS